MPTFLVEARQTLFPDAQAKDGPLPPLLLAMTLVTGLVDAFSYLALGHVFVANMTGNVVFLAFALAGAKEFSIAASLTALAAFALGGLVGGWIGAHVGAHRGRLLAIAGGIQAVFLAVSVLFAKLSGNPIDTGGRYPLIVALGVAMGIQNAAARKLAVPDLTTTVLTLTIVGVAADSAVAGGPGSRSGRRLLSVATMLLGALAGAALVLHVDVVDPLMIAFAVTAVVAGTAAVLGRRDLPWVRG